VIPIVEITWGEEDALTLPFPIATVEGDVIRTGLSVALGNIVLADQGQTIRDERLPPMPADRHTELRLKERDLTFCHGASDAAAGARPASLIVFQDPHTALPAITLTADGATWTPRLDLLESTWDSRAFVVEMESDRVAWLRFGDGVLGEKPLPDTQFCATYRVGNGITGNVGSDTIASFFVPASSGFFPDIRVRNPLPAQGGIDPEPMEQVRLNAPQAIYRQERCVTEADYAAIAERHPDVRQARASRQWTGSWSTIFLSINRRGGRPVDAAFQRELSAFIRPAMLTGADIIVLPPRFVPLEIALTAHIGAGYLPGVIRQALLETFGTGTLPDGQRAFFHPDNFSFGQSVYLSRVVAQAMRVHGVRWVTVDRFRRWHAADQGELTQGEIAIGPTEIARLDNDPNAPEWGQITFAIVPQRTDDDASVA
jgi:predicted phage baseplate assembly protein